VRVTSKVDVGVVTTPVGPTDVAAKPAIDVAVKPATDRKGLAAIARGVVDDAADARADPLALVPMRAIVLVQARIAELAKIDGFSDAVAFIGEKITEPPTVRAFEDCDLKFVALESVTFAMDVDEDAQLVLRGEGIGRAERWRCVKTKLGKEAGFDIVETESRTTLQTEDEMGLFVDEDTFIFADKTWDPDIVALLADKKAKTARDGKLHDVLARVNIEEPLWTAVIIPQEMAVALSASPFGGTEELWGAMSIGDKLALTLATRAASKSEAASMRDATQTQWDEVSSMASIVGMSAAVVSSVKFTALDDVLSFRMEASPEDVKKMAETISKF